MSEIDLDGKAARVPPEWLICQIEALLIWHFEDRHPKAEFGNIAEQIVKMINEVPPEATPRKERNKP